MVVQWWLEVAPPSKAGRCPPQMLQMVNHVRPKLNLMDQVLPITETDSKHNTTKVQKVLLAIVVVKSSLKEQINGFDF